MADDNVGASLTGLPLMDEFMFRNWVQQNRVPFDPNAANPDYDMRGFWQGLQQENPKAHTEVNPNDQQMHFTDYWKRPTHESFSAESKYATQSAPRWNRQDQLVRPDGTIVYDEKFNKALRRE